MYLVLDPRNALAVLDQGCGTDRFIFKRWINLVFIIQCWCYGSDYIPLFVLYPTKFNI